MKNPFKVDGSGYRKHQEMAVIMSFETPHLSVTSSCVWATEGKTLTPSHVLSSPPLKIWILLYDYLHIVQTYSSVFTVTRIVPIFLATLQPQLP